MARLKRKPDGVSLHVEWRGKVSLLAFLAFPERHTWSLRALAEVAARTRGAEARVRCDDSAGLVRVTVGDAELAIAPASTPISWELLDGPCRDAWHWREAAAVLRLHRSHLVVALVEGAGLPLPRALFLTRVAAEVGESFGYSGVYWESALLVHAAAAFTEAARAMTPRRLPLRLWVSFRIASEEDDTRSLATTGLDAFGEKEIEIWGSRAEPNEMIGWAYNTAHYLLAERAAIADGQALGTSPEEWVHVFVRPSMLDPSRLVYLLRVYPPGTMPESPENS